MDDPMSDDGTKTEPPSYQGHRQRLRERFLAIGGEAMQDYELLEMVLAMAQPRGDTKPLAKLLLKEFGSFASVIAATPEALMRVKGMGEVGVAALKVVAAAAVRLAREEIADKPLINSWNALIDYCRISMARES